MELFIFFKSKNKKGDLLFDIEFFRYNVLNKGLVKKLDEGIKAYKQECETSNSTKYNPLSVERGNKKIETMTIEEGENDSEIFKTYKNIILNSQLKDTTIKMGKKTYRLKKIKKYSDASFPVFYYAIKDGENIYFKKTSETQFLLKNKYKVFVRKDNATEADITDLIVIDTRFDFYTDTLSIFIKNGTAFEHILEYQNVFEIHKNKIIKKIEKADIIQDFGKFKNACNKENYFRAFKVVTESTDFKKTLSNKTFLAKLDKDTKGKIKWNSKIKKIELEDVHIKTVLHIFSGLIGIDIYDKIVIFNEKYAIPA